MDIFQTQRGYEMGVNRFFVIIDGKRKYLNKQDGDVILDGQLVNVKLTTKFRLKKDDICSTACVTQKAN